MYISINNTTYTDIRNLSFTSQVDITSDSVPVDEFSLEVKTDDSIEVGQIIELYDDLDQLWAHFWIIRADEESLGFITILAQSGVGLLDRVKLKPRMYLTNISLATAMERVFARFPQIDYEIDSSLDNAVVKGYCPKHTARDRLQWLCFATNACVKQSFTDKLIITAIDQETVSDIPVNQTYWRPTLNYQDYVTDITLICYNYTEGTPSQDDEWVEVDGTKYIVTEREFTLENDDVPEGAADNSIEVEGIGLANLSNASDIVSRLAMLYFSRGNVTADIINNRTYEPSQKVNIQIDDERGATGYIDSAEFEFGMQAKSSIKIVACDVRDLTLLVIWYMYDGANVATKRYNFPVGYSYQIENPYVTKSSGDHKYVFRPVNKYATGTMVEGRNTNTQQMTIALHWYDEQKLLHIISVSSIEFNSESKVLDIE